ncbi:MAG: YCF48-related protein [Zavarzinia sp.]|nr:YCF48-related protein [Zavarzinia sp.]
MRAFSKWEGAGHQTCDAARSRAYRPAGNISRRHLLALGGAGIVAASTFGVVGPARADAEPSRLFPDSLFGIVIDDGMAVATGYHGAVAVAAEGQGAWTLVDSGTDDLLRRVARRPKGGFIAVSHRGRILESDAQGRNWKLIHEEPGLYLRDVDFASEKVGWVVGHEGAILMTRDGGKSWSRSEISDYQGRDKPRLSGISALDEQHAVVVGEFGVIAATEDGGAVWRVVTEQAYPSLLDVALVGNRGYAVGLNGTLLALSASEGVWSAAPVATGTEQHLLAVDVSTNGREGVVVGNGLLMTVGPKGLDAANVAPAVGLNYLWLGGVALGDDGRALAVGQGGLILAAAHASGPYAPQEKSNDIQEVTQ